MDVGDCWIEVVMVSCFCPDGITPVCGVDVIGAGKVAAASLLSHGFPCPTSSSSLGKSHCLTPVASNTKKHFEAAWSYSIRHPGGRMMDMTALPLSMKT